MAKTKALNLNKINYKGMRRVFTVGDWHNISKDMMWTRNGLVLKGIKNVQKKYSPLRHKNLTGRMIHVWLIREFKRNIKSYKVARNGSMPEHWLRIRMWEWVTN